MAAFARAVREHIVDMCAGPEGGHLGGSMSAVEILVALFFRTMDIDPADPEWKQRDIFVLSKGHAAMALYATLAERGFIPREEVATFCRPGSRLATHGNVAVPGVEFATGSLGHGLALANGTAWAQRQAGGTPGGTPARTFVLLGDGELQEGTVWEAAQVARALNADNLVAVVDVNDFQQTGAVREVSDGAPVADRWAASAGTRSRWTGTTWRRSARPSTARPAPRGRPPWSAAPSKRGAWASWRAAPPRTSSGSTPSASSPGSRAASDRRRCLPRPAGEVRPWLRPNRSG